MDSLDRRQFLQESSGLVAAFSLAPEVLARAPRRLSESISVAVVGTGKQGRDILAELAKFPDVQIEAVCDTDPTRLRRAVRRTKGAASHADLSTLLEKHPKVSAVFVATPTHLHREPALAAWAAGRHVYCEAPMASTMDDLQALAKAAAAGGRVFQVGHVARSNPVYKLARSFIRSGAIQDVIQLSASFHRKNSWRTPVSDATEERRVNWRLYHETSGGLALEVGSHQLDAIRWYLKKEPRSVRGQGAILHYTDGREVPDTIRCTFDYGEGLNLDYSATLANSFQGVHELYYGTMGTVRMAERFGWMFKEADAPVQGWEVYASRQQFHDEQGITLIADATKLASQGKLKEGIGLPHPPLYYAVESFLSSVTKGEAPVCSAMDGLHAAATALEANRAVRSGDTVSISEDLFKI